jgi:hypothetical protein
MSAFEGKPVAKKFSLLPLTLGLSRQGERGINGKYFGNRQGWAPPKDRMVGEGGQSPPDLLFK